MEMSTEHSSHDVSSFNQLLSCLRSTVAADDDDAVVAVATVDVVDDDAAVVHDDISWCLAVDVIDGGAASMNAAGVDNRRCCFKR